MKRIAMTQLVAGMLAALLMVPSALDLNRHAAAVQQEHLNATLTRLDAVALAGINRALLDHWKAAVIYVGNNRPDEVSEFCKAMREKGYRIEPVNGTADGILISWRS